MSAGARAPTRRARARPARATFFLFLTLWLGYGLTVNSSNLYEFNLQQIGVEAIAERGNFYLEGSRVPELVPRGDVFLYGGRKYAAKQPGQFMAGALAYTPLRPFGVSYLADYLLASALVTFLTASLVTALAGLAVFRLARSLDPDPEGLARPLAVALTYGFATTAFPYAGIAHHDALASGYLLLAFYLVSRVARAPAERGGRGERLRAAGAGLLLGLTLTTSMLPALMTAVVGVYFVTLRRFGLLPHFAAGALAGLLPLLVYNAASFGNPLLMPNVAGNYSDTFFRPDAENFLDKLSFYTRAVALYVPVSALGAAGLLLYPRARRREQLTMLALIIGLLAYVLNIDTRGGHQYGPRYLLPLMPYAALGLVGFAYVTSALRRRLALFAVAAAALFSAAVNLLGALHGSMYSDTAPYAAPVYLSAIARGEMRHFPLAAWLAVPFVVSLVMLCYCAWPGRGESSSR